MKPLPWSHAVETVCEELEWFATWQSAGLSVPEIARTMNIRRRTAKRYAATISRLMADLKNEAAPGSVQPAAAPEKAQTDNTE